MKISDLDIIYLSYREPYKTQTLRELKKLRPTILNVDGVDGFDEAHKICAKMSKTDNFVVIDGDNVVHPHFFESELPDSFVNDHEVISFSAHNTVNGLEYGYGGIKIWPKKVALMMSTHEYSKDELSDVDFCFSVPYRQMHSVMSDTFINQSPIMAFRAGFRENIKMNLDAGKRIQIDEIPSRLFYQNRRRSLIWMSVGKDVEYGIYSIIGAKISWKLLYLTDWDHRLINNFDDIQEIYDKHIGKLNKNELEEYSQRLTDEIQSHSIKVAELNSDASIMFKETFMNPLRTNFQITECEYREMVKKRSNHVYLQ